MEGAPPSAWRVARAILPLPFVATVVVPVLILAGGGEDWGWPGAGRAAAMVAGLALIALGVSLFVATVRLFATRGRGTLAPWDPPTRLVVAGPYRHLRHPMISGVASVLAGETLVFERTGLAIWLVTFVAVNAVYLPLVEEPQLVRRFGADYERYKRHVRRWVPRLRPWDPRT
jgi:protein-S-isoprenylcysteine O-methyltransferase Ste14